MKIALVGNDFDFSSKDGISRYSYELYKRLKEHNTVYTYESKKQGTFTGDMFEGLKRHFIGTRIEEDVDIVHLMYPNTTHAISSAPQALTWHDAAIFSRYKTHNSFSKDFYHWLGVILPALKNTKRANGLTYNSEETRKSLIPYIGKCEEKVNKVILHGIDDIFVKEKVKHNVGREDFMYVGSLQYAHKNIPFLISAFRRASKGNNDLHIFTPTSRELINEDYFHIDNVHIHIKASTKELIEKLKTSIALLHFSKLEGFGLPILESMAVGTPVVVLKDAFIPKAVTRYAIKSTMSSASSTIEWLAKEKPELSDSAIQYAKSFNWGRTANLTFEFYKEIIEKNR
ncbi:MAG: glycosyltransferase [Candidatus Micrarchaeia archaeon]